MHWNVILKDPGFHSSAVLLAELFDVLAREKFAVRLAQAGLSPLIIVSELRRMAHLVAPAEVPRVIIRTMTMSLPAQWQHERI